MQSTTGISHTILRSLDRLGSPGLAALTLLVFALTVTAMLTLDLLAADPEMIMIAPLRW